MNRDSNYLSYLESKIEDQGKKLAQLEKMVTLLSGSMPDFGVQEKMDYREKLYDLPKPKNRK